VFERLADVEKVRLDRARLHDALCLPSRELDTLYPRGPVISLAQRSVRDVALGLVHTQAVKRPAVQPRSTESSDVDGIWRKQV
jgi:hypothetical protein